MVITVRRRGSSRADHSAWFIMSCGRAHSAGIWESVRVHVWLQRGPESLATNCVKYTRALTVFVKRWPFRNVFVSDAAAAAVTLTSPPLWLPLVPSHFLLRLSETDSCPSAFLPLVGRLFITMADISPAPDAILIVLMKHFFFSSCDIFIGRWCLHLRRNV